RSSLPPSRPPPVRGRRRGGLDWALLASRRAAFDEAVGVFLGAGEGFFGLGGFALTAPHLGVEAFLGEERGVVTAFGDLTFAEHEDFIGIDDGGEPVGDDHTGAVARYDV